MLLVWFQKYRDIELITGTMGFERVEENRQLQRQSIDAKRELSFSIEAQSTWPGLDLALVITRAHGVLRGHSIMSSRDHSEAVIPSTSVAHQLQTMLHNTP